MIAFIVFAIIIIGATALYIKARIKNAGKASGKLLAAAYIVAAVILLGGFSYTIIPTGYTGVQTTFGQINETTLQNGWNWKIPFIQSIQLVNNKQQDITFDGQIWSETKERTAIYYDGITVTYTINADESAWIYAHVNNYEESLVSSNLVASAIKSSSKELSSEDATNRSIIEPLVQQNLQESLDGKYERSVVSVNKVVISNVDFEDSYNAAIADKQAAQLAYEKQAIVNKQNVEKAEADATVKKTEAQAEADAALIKAEAEAKANTQISSSLTDNVLKNKFYEKWDGKLPTVFGGNNIMDISSIMNGATAADSQ